MRSQAVNAALSSVARAKTGKERAGILRCWFDLMMANQDDLAAIMTAEQGKLLVEAKGEIAYAASFIEWSGEEAKRHLWRYDSGIHDRQADCVVLKQPIGACAAITPWNFPGGDDHAQGRTGLAAGCTMVVKPAGQDATIGAGTSRCWANGRGPQGGVVCRRRGFGGGDRR